MWRIKLFGKPFLTIVGSAISLASCTGLHDIGSLCPREADIYVQPVQDVYSLSEMTYYFREEDEQPVTEIVSDMHGNAETVLPEGIYQGIALTSSIPALRLEGLETPKTATVSLRTVDGEAMQADMLHVLSLSEFTVTDDEDLVLRPQPKQRTKYIYCHFKTETEQQIEELRTTLSGLDASVYLFGGEPASETCYEMTGEMSQDGDDTEWLSSFATLGIHEGSQRYILSVDMLAGRSLYTEIDLTSDFTTLLSGVDECPDEIHVEITLSATKDKLNYHLDRIWWRFGLIVEEEVS